ncbi:MAG: hypothetical protein R2815_11170 [Flavobacteriales bacterium]
MMPAGGRFLSGWWVAWAALAVVVRLLSEGILEGGDGIMHYQIARFSWVHPELFLDHWGKPLFTLFASPFAQLGHWGMVVFNALCMVATAWAADRILQHSGRFAQWAYAPALLMVPVYGTMVLAGMTEVFFGMLTMLVILALFTERYRTALIVASFMPFSRPEYIAFVPFVVLWVIYRRQWRSLPYVFVGHVLYAVIGGIVLQDPLWAIHNDPYTGASAIYGSGDPFHFTGHIQRIFGAPTVWLLAFALVAGSWSWWREARSRRTLELLVVVAFLPSLAILVLHSVLWWKGWKGSLGLHRVLATTAPMVVLCALWPVGWLVHNLLKDRNLRIAVEVLALCGVVLLGALAFIAERPIPVEEDQYQRFLADVGARVKALRPRYDRVIYYHPQVGFHAEMDPFDTSTTALYWQPDRDRPSLGLRSSDLLVWDAHVGPNEGATPLELLTSRPDLELVELMVPNARMEVLGGHVFEVYMFRAGTNEGRFAERRVYGPQAGLAVPLEHRTDVELKGGNVCFPKDEFPFEIFGIPCDTIGLLFAEVIVSGDFMTDEAGARVHCVMTEHDLTGQLDYWSHDLSPGPFEITYRIPPRSADVTNKLHFWNEGGAPFCIDSLMISVRKHLRPS